MVIGAAALAIVTGLVNPNEKVNSLAGRGSGLYLCAGLSVLWQMLATPVVGLNNPHVTPAVRLNDGVQYPPGFGKNVTGGANSYGMNISCRTARTAARVPGVMRPSRLTRRSLSTVRN